MKRLTSVALFFTFLFFGVIHTATAQNNEAVDMFKKHINNIVEKVEEAKTPVRKRELLNTSFNKLLASFDKVEKMKTLSESDQAAINDLQSTIIEKKNELNGMEGYRRVPDNQLNNFANFVQQDLEQADQTITISVTVLLLIIIILILL